MSIYISEHALRNHVNDGGVTGGGLESLGARPALAGRAPEVLLTTAAGAASALS